MSCKEPFEKKDFVVFPSVSLASLCIVNVSFVKYLIFWKYFGLGPYFPSLCSHRLLYKSPSKIINMMSTQR